VTATLVDLVHSLPSWVVFLLVFLAPCLEASAFVGPSSSVESSRIRGACRSRA